MGIFIIIIGILIIFVSGDGRKHKIMSKEQKRQVLIGVLVIALGIYITNNEYYPNSKAKKQSEYKYPVDMKDR